MYIISFINLFVDVMCRFEEDDEEVVQKPSGRVKQVAVKAGGGRACDTIAEESSGQDCRWQRTRRGEEIVVGLVFVVRC